MRHPVKRWGSPQTADRRSQIPAPSEWAPGADEPLGSRPGGRPPRPPPDRFRADVRPRRSEAIRTPVGEMGRGHGRRLVLPVALIRWMHPGPVGFRASGRMVRQPLPTGRTTNFWWRPTAPQGRERASRPIGARRCRWVQRPKRTIISVLITARYGTANYRKTRMTTFDHIRGRITREWWSGHPECRSWDLMSLLQTTVLVENRPEHHRDHMGYR